MDLQPLSVDAMLQDVIALVRADAASRHVTVDCAVEPGLPPVAGDRVHLSQVLLNLIINAMDAVKELEQARRRVSVRARRTPGPAVEIVVHDSGPGIPHESLARVFEPFYTTKSGGMGMGLSISRTIVDAHGGRLSAENVPGGGASFTMSLPFAQGAAT
jgi:signal transduction histidine kinase